MAKRPLEQICPVDLKIELFKVAKPGLLLLGLVAGREKENRLARELHESERMKIECLPF
jgi:hypothetical protein